jgi:hypothetical protein
MKKLLALCVAALLTTAVGCGPASTTTGSSGPKPSSPGAAASPTAGADIVLEIAEITIEPGKDPKTVKVTAGKADTVKVEPEGAVKAEVKDGVVTVTAPADAKDAEVTVSGKEGKPAKLKVKTKS